MTPQRVFITGASGCIGHHVTEALMKQPGRELFLLVRDPGRLALDPQARPGITVLPGTMQDISRYAGLLKTIHVVVHAAASWGGPAVFDTNVTRTLELLSLLDPAVCERVVYFSTASVLDRQHRPLSIAAEVGTPYIRAKYECLQRLADLPIAPRVSVLFPTVVLAGGTQSPSTQFNEEVVPRLLRWFDLIRFLRIDASLHFIHARDVARVVQHLIDEPPGGNGPRPYVLGQPAITIDEAVEELCAYLGKPIYFRVPVPLGLVSSMIGLLPRNVPERDRAWTRYCLRVRHLTYERPTNPATFGLPTHCPTLTDYLRLSGLAGRRPERGAVRRPG